MLVPNKHEIVSSDYKDFVEGFGAEMFKSLHSISKSYFGQLLTKDLMVHIEQDLAREVHRLMTNYRFIPSIEIDAKVRMEFGLNSAPTGQLRVDISGTYRCRPIELDRSTMNHPTFIQWENYISQLDLIYLAGVFQTHLIHIEHIEYLVGLQSFKELKK